MIEVKNITGKMQLSRLMGLSKLSGLSGLSKLSGLRGLSKLSKLSRLSKLSGLIGLIGLISSCSSELDELDEPEDLKGVILRVMGYENDYVEVDAVTRATVSWQPAGYTETHVYISYGIFFTKSDGSVVNNKFHYGADKKWRMKEEVTPGDYYLYGYMPYDAGTVTIAPPASGDYKDGAVMTFSNLNAAMVKDFCIITSAKDATRDNAPEWTAENPKYTYTLANGKDWLPPADFKCNIKSGEGTNTLFFLFEHLYAALRLRFRVSEDYNNIRDIRLKRLELAAYKDAACTQLMPKLRTTITLAANNTETSPIVGDVVFEEETGSDVMKPVVLYDNSNPTNDDNLPCNDGLGNPIYTDNLGYVPKSGGENYYKLTTIYDIYDKNQAKDKDGNLIFDEEGEPVYNKIRENCVAENILNPKALFNQPRLQRGNMYTLRLTISPTYLYVLSEPDLDNPSIKLE